MPLYATAIGLELVAWAVNELRRERARQEAARDAAARYRRDRRAVRDSDHWGIV
jgi:DNA-binding IclR family transcriptional regulator